MTNDLTTLRAVADAIRELYGIDRPLYVEYPGFLAIPESIVNDDTDGSAAVWCVGQDGDHWTGNLMRPDGTNVDGMSFAVWPVSDRLEDIASAIYCHGIGDLYIGGGCTDCPVRRG